MTLSKIGPCRLKAMKVCFLFLKYLIFQQYIQLLVTSSAKMCILPRSMNLLEKSFNNNAGDFPLAQIKTSSMQGNPPFPVYSESKFPKHYQFGSFNWFK